MTMTYPAPEHEALDFFGYLPDFSKMEMEKDQNGKDS